MLSTLLPTENREKAEKLSPAVKDAVPYVANEIEKKATQEQREVTELVQQIRQEKVVARQLDQIREQVYYKQEDIDNIIAKSGRNIQGQSAVATANQDSLAWTQQLLEQQHKSLLDKEQSFVAKLSSIRSLLSPDLFSQLQDTLRQGQSASAETLLAALQNIIRMMKGHSGLLKLFVGTKTVGQLIQDLNTTEKLVQHTAQVMHLHQQELLNAGVELGSEQGRLLALVDRSGNRIQEMAVDQTLDELFADAKIHEQTSFPDYLYVVTRQSQEISRWQTILHEIYHLMYQKKRLSARELEELVQKYLSTQVEFIAAGQRPGFNKNLFEEAIMIFIKLHQEGLQAGAQKLSFEEIMQNPELQELLGKIERTFIKYQIRGRTGVVRKLI